MAQNTDSVTATQNAHPYLMSNIDSECSGSQSWASTEIKSTRYIQLLMVPDPLQKLQFYLVIMPDVSLEPQVLPFQNRS